MSTLYISSSSKDEVLIILDGKKYIIGSGGNPGILNITSSSKLIIGNKSKAYSVDVSSIISNSSSSATWPTIFVYDTLPSNMNSNGNLTVYMQLSDGTYQAWNGPLLLGNQLTISKLVTPVKLTTSPRDKLISMLPFYMTLVPLIILLIVVAMIFTLVGILVHKFIQGF
jgi:hypothetical protein